MNFKKGAAREEPEINLIPLIDLFLVIIIFLMVTTTYSRFSELKIELPTAAGEQQSAKPVVINVDVGAHGEYQVDGKPIPGNSPDELAKALKAAKAGANPNAKDAPIVVINADAQTTHQSVINVMEAARDAELAQITFATKNAPGK